MDTLIHEGARIVDRNGKYYGTITTNQFDPDSISNPNGQYGPRFRFSSDNIHNIYNRYGTFYLAR